MRARKDTDVMETERFKNRLITVLGSLALTHHGSDTMIRRRFWFMLIVAVLVFGLNQLFVPRAPAEDAYSDIRESIVLFGRVYQQLIGQYVDTLEPDAFIEAGIEGMLRSLDPYTVLLEENDRDNLNIITRGKYGGVGIRIGIMKDTLTVISAVDDTPAQRLGIRPGDRIIAIEEHPTDGFSTEEAADLMRGTPGTEVKVTSSGHPGQVVLDVRGSRLALGHGVSAKILVDIIDEKKKR